MIFAGLIVNIHGWEQTGVIARKAAVVGYLFSFGDRIFNTHPCLSAPFLPFFIKAYITGVYILAVNEIVRTVVGFPGAIIVAFVFYFVVVLYIDYLKPGIETEVVL